MMPASEAEDRTQLAERMDRERIRGRRGTWDEVAREMGISSALLRRIRKGTVPISYESELKIELFYNWPEGTLRAELAKAEPTENTSPKTPESDTSTPADATASTRPHSGVRVLVAQLPPHEWTAEDRAVIQAMSIDEITEFGRKLGRDYDQETQLRFLRAALEIKATAAAKTPESATSPVTATNDSDIK